MDFKDLHPKLTKVLHSISQEELCTFASTYALCNTDFALALVERYWKPDASDYREQVDACFVHPFLVSTKYGESLDWNAVTDDVRLLVQLIQVKKECNDPIGAAQMALYLMVRIGEEYEKDHLYERNYDDAWHERWKPLRDCMRECHQVVCELLIDGDVIDDDTQRGLVAEMAERIKELKKCVLIRMDWVWEDILEKMLSPKRYLTYLNNQIKKSSWYEAERFFRRKLRFLNKIGKRVEALNEIDLLANQHNESSLRTIAIELLMEWGEYEKSIELILSADDNDFYAFSGKYSKKLVSVLEKIGDRNRSLEILKAEFIKTDRKKVYYEELRKLLNDEEWNAFISDIMADADHVFTRDYEDIEAQIYLERMAYDKLILFCRRQDYDAHENLTKYGKYMPLDDQKEVAEHIAERIKGCFVECKRSKDYARHVEWIQQMIDSCEGGRIVANDLVDYLREEYGNRPALMNWLMQLNGL